MLTDFNGAPGRICSVADFTLEIGDVMTNSYAESYTNPGTIAADLNVVQIDISSDGRKRYILEDGRELFDRRNR